MSQHLKQQEARSNQPRTRYMKDNEKEFLQESKSGDSKMLNIQCRMKEIETKQLEINTIVNRLKDELGLLNYDQLYGFFPNSSDESIMEEQECKQNMQNDPIYRSTFDPYQFLQINNSQLIVSSNSSIKNNNVIDISTSFDDLSDLAQQIDRACNSTSTNQSTSNKQSSKKNSIEKKQISSETTFQQNDNSNLILPPKVMIKIPKYSHYDFSFEDKPESKQIQIIIEDTKGEIEERNQDEEDEIEDIRQKHRREQALKLLPCFNEDGSSNSTLLRNKKKQTQILKTTKQQIFKFEKKSRVGQNENREELNLNTEQRDLKHLKNTDDPHQDQVCPICLEVPTQFQGRLGCNHKFCYNCIERSAETQTQCPKCRAQFDQIEMLAIKKGKIKNFTKIIPPNLTKPQLFDSDFSFYNPNEQDSYIPISSDPPELSSSDYSSTLNKCYECGKRNTIRNLMQCTICFINYCHTYCQKYKGFKKYQHHNWVCRICEKHQNLK